MEVTKCFVWLFTLLKEGEIRCWLISHWFPGVPPCLSSGCWRIRICMGMRWSRRWRRNRTMSLPWKRGRCIRCCIPWRRKTIWLRMRAKQTGNCANITTSRKWAESTWNPGRRNGRNTRRQCLMYLYPCRLRHKRFTESVTVPYYGRGWLKWKNS